MTPEETINRGHFLFMFAVIFGGGFSIGAGAFAIHIGESGLEPIKNLIYFLTSLLACLAGISGCFFSISEAVKCWRIGRRWREQAAGTVTIQGTFAAWWIEQGMSNKTLVKIQRRDGSSKMLLVGLEFDNALPEVGEDVQIDYLFGCEAVVDVKSLAAGAVPADN
jgi:hypothetical protein